MKAFLLIFSMGWFVQGFAQQEYFVFLQSESRQPFYVRMGEKTYSSSAAGYLILSKLKDSVYVLSIGFPQGQFPEQEFSVRINKKDQGFELKNLGQKGWALFNWHTMELISPAKPAGAGSGGSTYNMVKKNDDFARLMAGVVNDTAVLYMVVAEEKKQPVLVSKDTVASKSDVAKVEKKAEVSPDIKKGDQDSAGLKKTEVAVEIKKPDAEAKKPVEQLADTVRAIKDHAVTKDVAKDDHAAKDTAIIKPDVVKVDPPVKKAEDSVNKVEDLAKKTEEPLKKIEEPIKKPEETIKKTAETVAETKKDQDPMKDSVLNPPALPVIAVVRQYATDTGYHMVIMDGVKDSINIFIPADTTANISSQLSSAAKDKAIDTLRRETRLVMMNSDCKSVATGMDVDKLRVKLVAEKDSEGRIAAAKKVFKTKCFTAAQMKALSELFPLDEQKYKFLETAYPFVSDTGNFKELVSLLNDPAYVQRFRKLVRLD